MKPKKYWLRGGLIVGTVYLILFLLILLQDPFASFGTLQFLVVFPGFGIANYLGYSIPNDYPSHTYYAGMFIAGFTTLCVFFTIGALIGWFVGKTKKV